MDERGQIHKAKKEQTSFANKRFPPGSALKDLAAQYDFLWRVSRCTGFCVRLAVRRWHIWPSPAIAPLSLLSLRFVSINSP